MYLRDITIKSIIFYQEVLVVQWLCKPTTDPATLFRYPAGISFFFFSVLHHFLCIALGRHRNSANDMHIIDDFLLDLLVQFTYLGSRPWFTPLAPVNHCCCNACSLLISMLSNWCQSMTKVFLSNVKKINSIFSVIIHASLPMPKLELFSAFLLRCVEEL
jgi:hypothetical protein